MKPLKIMVAGLDAYSDLVDKVADQINDLIKSSSNISMISKLFKSFDFFVILVIYGGRQHTIIYDPQESSDNWHYKGVLNAATIATGGRKNAVAIILTDVKDPVEQDHICSIPTKRYQNIPFLRNFLFFSSRWDEKFDAHQREVFLHSFLKVMGGYIDKDQLISYGNEMGVNKDVICSLYENIEQPSEDLIKEELESYESIEQFSKDVLVKEESKSDDLDIKDRAKWQCILV